MSKKGKDLIRRPRRDFVRDISVFGGAVSIMLAINPGVAQASSSEGTKQRLVLSRPAPDEHIAACGIFCSNCKRFKKGKCKGCQIEPGYECATRDCCIEKGITGCWDCDKFKAPANYKDCKKINTFMGKVWKLLYKTDRPAALAMIRDQGKEAFIKSKMKSGKM